MNSLRLTASVILIGLILSAFSTTQAQSTFNWSSPQSFSGSESSGVHTRNWAPGISTGYFNVSFEFYSIPDSMVITFGGQPVYSTGGYISGSQTVSLSFGPSAPGTYPNLQVVMNPQGPRPGTEWRYTLTPTSKPVLVSLDISGPSSLGGNSTGTYVATARYSNGSSKVVSASWRSSTSLLRVLNSGNYAEALATGITRPTEAILAATYSEDGITKQAIQYVSLDTGSTTNNPDGEEKLDPDAQDESKEGGPIHTGTGAESFYRPLISISGVRDFEFGLHYSSTFSGVASPVGLGWSHPHAPRIEESGDEVTIRWSPTQANEYNLVRSNTGAVYVSGDDASRFDVLQKTGDNGFILTKPDQTKYTFNSSRNLTEVSNARGQKLTVSSSSGILSTVTEPVSGARLTFTHTSGRLTRVVDNLNRAVNLAYDSSGRLTTITDLNGRITTYGYNTAGKLSSVTAPDGNVIYRNTYDALGRVASQDDGVSGNREMTFAYSETRTGSVVTTVTDRTGYKTVYVHDALYRLQSVRNPLGHTILYTYDRFGNRITARDALGRITQTSYDERGNPTRILAPNGGETRMEYDVRNNLVRLTNPDGKTATTVYDAANNPLQITNFAGERTVRTFNANSQVLTERSPRGNTTTYAYTSGRLSSIANPLGQTRTFAHDAVGRLTSTTNEAGRTTTFSYSPSSKILEETNPLGAKIRYAYDVRDRLVTITDQVGGVTTRTYDANNNILTITDALGGVSRNEYDGEDRLRRSIDALGRITAFTYDAAGRLIASTDPLGQTSRFGYDAAGNRVSVVLPTGDTVVTTYSTQDLPVRVRDAIGRTTVMDRDVLGREIQETDPLRRTTGTTYDAMGRPTSQTDPAGLVVRRGYDLDGNLTTLTNAAGVTTTFAYDTAGRQTSLRTPANRTTAYLYEARGLVSRVTEPSGQVTNNTYDNAGRLITRADPVGTTTYTYDAKHRLLTVVEGGKTITRVYDALDRLTRFTDGNGNVLQYAYDAVGNLTRLTYPDGKQVNYSYDAANRMTGVTDWAGRTTSYGYDRAGRLLSTIRPNGTRQARTYDRAGQLTSLRELSANGAVIAGYTFTYDAAGQLVSERRSPAPPAALPDFVNMAYDTDDRLTSFNGNAVTQDADGNMTRGPINGALGNFTYDARNRLTAAGGLIYRYDAENRRVESQSGSIVTSYVNDPNAPLWRVLSFKTGSGTPTYCVHGIGLIYTETAGTPVYHHYDLRGSTVATTDGGGIITFSTAYGAYGESIPVSGGTAPTPFLFVGQYGVMTDANGLCFSRARYYHSGIKRFVNADPLGFGGGVNWYAYAGGNPITRTDASGMWFGIDDAIFAGGGALLGVGGKLIGDLITGSSSTWHEYVGAAVGGAVAGETLLYTANPYIAGGAGGLASNLTTQGLMIADGKQDAFNTQSLFFDTSLGALAGLIPGQKIPGITAGRGSHIQVFHQILTKAEKGLISGVELQTAIKMMEGAFVKFAFAEGAVAGTTINNLLERLKELKRRSESK